MIGTASDDSVFVRIKGTLCTKRMSTHLYRGSWCMKVVSMATC